MEEKTRWQDLNWFDIRKIPDEKTRAECYLQYFQYVYYISQYIQEELEKRGLTFEYSGTIKGMTIQQMSDELNSFCEDHGIFEEERHQIVVYGFIRDLIRRKRFDEAQAECNKYQIPYEEIRGRKR